MSLNQSVTINCTQQEHASEETKETLHIHEDNIFHTVKCTKPENTTNTSPMSLPKLNSQNELLMQNLMSFYSNSDNMDVMIQIINGESNISLRIIDWFATNYAKKHFTVYDVKEGKRFKVYIDYKLKLKAYSKKRFDPFCRWDRISIPYKDNTLVQTTLGQLNFFKWAIENNVIKYIEENYANIERDMNSRNSTAKNNSSNTSSVASKNKTRKKREELSISASRSIKKENVQITVTFN
jgi:hypothetical protein